MQDIRPPVVNTPDTAIKLTDTTDVNTGNDRYTRANNTDDTQVIIELYPQYLHTIAGPGKH